MVTGIRKIHSSAQEFWRQKRFNDRFAVAENANKNGFVADKPDADAEGFDRMGGASTFSVCSMLKV